jgi:hypothetical protein
VITTATRGLTFFMPETGGIVTSTFTSDSGGGATATRGTVTSPCRIDALAGNESEVANRISDRSTHIVSFPAETTVTSENDLVIGSTEYEITAVRDYTGELTRVVEVVAQ